MVNEVSKLIKRGIHIKTLDKRLDLIAMPKEIKMLIVSILGYTASKELEQSKSRSRGKGFQQIEELSLEEKGFITNIR